MTKRLIASFVFAILLMSGAAIAQTSSTITTPAPTVSAPTRVSDVSQSPESQDMPANNGEASKESGEDVGATAAQ